MICSASKLVCIKLCQMSYEERCCVCSSDVIEWCGKEEDTSIDDGEEKNNFDGKREDDCSGATPHSCSWLELMLLLLCVIKYY